MPKPLVLLAFLTTNLACSSSEPFDAHSSAASQAGGSVSFAPQSAGGGEPTAIPTPEGGDSSFPAANGDKPATEPTEPAQPGGTAGTSNENPAGGAAPVDAGGEQAGSSDQAEGTAGAGGQPSSVPDETQPDEPDMDPEQPAPRPIAYVAGNSNNTSSPGEAIGDVFLITRLEESLGHSVTLLADSLPAAELQAAAEASDLVIVAESTTSNTLSDKLRSVRTTVLSFEAFIQDEMGMTDVGPPGDPGLPADFALGVKANETDIDIIDPSHPLAAGLSGTVTVYSVPQSITWGTVGPAADVVATLPGDLAGATIYVYAAGSTLFDGTTAAGTRIGYFLEDDNTTGTPNLMTEQGLQLFDAAIEWALNQ